MRPFPTLLGFLFAGFTMLAQATDTPPADAAQLAGHYYLEDGPTEVGSELLLKASGQFEWTLVYGADDYDVKGTWTRNGEVLVLQPEASPEPAFAMFRPDEYPASEPIPPGQWYVATTVDGEFGVADVAVRFESRSGKAWHGITDGDGVAYVAVPAGETWTRTGLRRAGSTVPWQWFDVPAARAAARAVGFRLTNVRDLKHSPFKSLRLRPDDTGLVIEAGIGSLRGTYTKH